jgi:hypothetical protein
MAKSILQWNREIIPQAHTGHHLPRCLLLWVAVGLQTHLQKEGGQEERYRGSRRPKSVFFKPNLALPSGAHFSAHAPPFAVLPGALGS